MHLGRVMHTALFIIAVSLLIAAGAIALHGWYRSPKQIARRETRRRREERLATTLRSLLDDEIG
jgi:uncharacterized membrane protein YidH (DUF202 family)